MVVDLDKRARIAQPSHGQFAGHSKGWLLHGDVQSRRTSNPVRRPGDAKGNPFETAKDVGGLGAVERSITELGRIPAIDLPLYTLH